MTINEQTLNSVTDLATRIIEAVSAPGQTAGEFILNNVPGLEPCKITVEKITPLYEDDPEAN